jgi:hypothetical protein
MQKKYILVAVIPVVVSVAMAFYFYGIVFEKKANVEITSIKRDTLIYGGQTHQEFTGYLANVGDAEARNVVVHVSWLDGKNGEHVGTCVIGMLGVGESKPFTVDFVTGSFTVMSYYTQWVTFE